MIGRKNAVLALAFGFALAAAATPTLARSTHAGYDARAEALAGAGEISAYRAEALRECNAASAKTLEYVWGDMQRDQVSACMAQHGQVE